MFFHNVQEVDDPASDGDSDHTDSEGIVWTARTHVSVNCPYHHCLRQRRST